MATTTMTSSMLETAAPRGRSLENIRTFFQVASAAIRCAAAVESGYRPNNRDLKTLGIGESLSRVGLHGR